MSTSILPPFPDELVKPEEKERAIAFLRGLRLPRRMMTTHLARWSLMTGREIPPGEMRALRFGDETGREGR